jgi:polygalacturonase
MELNDMLRNSSVTSPFFIRMCHRWFLVAAVVFLLSAFFSTGDAGKLKHPQVARPSIPAAGVNLIDCGGVGDGVFVNTEAFASAMAKLKATKGGRLIVPPGIWLTGPVRLASNIDLHVMRGAVIRFSGDYKLYPLVVTDTRGEKEINSTSPISGQDLQNVAITGEGIIDGGGDAWRPIKKNKLTDVEWQGVVRSGGVLNEKKDTWWPSVDAMQGEEVVNMLLKKGSLDPAAYEPARQYLRPKMVRLIGCKRILIDGVIFQNPPNWTLNPVLCEDVSILNVVVRNAETAQNSDALDLESCRHAIVRGCMFDVGDDGICLKSGKDEVGRRIGVATEDVLIENCTVFHAHGGFTIGSEMSGGVRNIRVNNCTFVGTDIGLRFKSTRGRGGVVEKIFISNITMLDIPGDAINFNMYYGGKSPLEDAGGVRAAEYPPVTEGTPRFRDIHVENVTCRGARGAIVLQGLPEMPLQDISVRNVVMSSDQGVSVTDAERITFENVGIQHRSGEALKAVRVKDSKLGLKQ